MINQFTKTALAYNHARNSILAFLFLLFLLPAASGQGTNQALSFDGSNSHVVLGTVNPTNNFSTGITIECWVKWGAFNTWSRLLDMGNGASSDNVLLANESSTGRLRFEVYRGSVIQGLSIPSSLETNRWYHVAVTQTNAGLTTLYVDGVQVISGTIQTPNDISRANCYIGRSAWVADGYLNGSVDEFRIWNVARTATEIRNNMFKNVASNATGLVAYYAFNEGSGTAVTNARSGMGAGNGTVSNIGRVTSPAQLTGNSIVLDGTDDYANIGNPLSAGTSYTKEAWVFVTKSTTLPQNIISSNNSPFWISGGYLRAGNNLATSQVTDPGAFPSNTWVHVAVTFNAGTNTMRLYRNGVQVDAATVTSAYTNQTNYIGSWFNTTNESFFGGKIDEVRIWNSARTQSEIAANMYNELNPSLLPNLVAYYTFNQGVAGGDNTGMITVPNQVGTTNATLVNFALNNSTSNFDVQQNNLVVLPIRLAQFTAQKQKGSVLLQWATSSEESSSKFLVEHSSNSKDWSLVAELAAAGNSAVTKNYQVIHASPVTGLNYYRLVHLDKNGKTDYSTIRSVLFEEKAKPFAIVNAQQTGVQVQVNTATTLSLLSQDGKLLWIKAVTPGLISIPVTSHAKGIFYLTGSGTTERVFIP